MSSVKITIVSDNELRLSLPDENGGVDASVTQKLVSVKEGPKDSTFDMDGLLETASYLHDSEDLRKRYPDEVEALGWVLYHDPKDPERHELVETMFLLMTAWTVACSRDESCLMPPSRAFMNDPAARKVIRAYQKLSDSQPKLP